MPANRSIQSRAMTGALWSAVSAVGLITIQLVQLAVLGRLLSAEDFGLVAMAMVILGVANAYSDVGLSNAILTHQGITSQHLASLYWLNWGASVFAAMAIWFAAPLAAWGFGEHQLQPLVVWLAATLLAVPLGLQYQLLLQKELRLKPIALIEVCSGLLGLAVSIISALNGQGAYSLVFGSLTVALVKAVAFFLVGFRRWPVTMHFALADVRPYLGFGVYQVGERTLNFAAWNLDKVMIGGLLGAHALGIYNVAYQLMQKPLQFVMPIVSRIALPLFSSMSEESSRLRSGYLLVIQGLGMLLFPIFALIFVLAEPVILLLVGSSWLDAVPVLRWLAILGCFYTIGFPIGSLLLARRRADVAFWMNVFGIVANAVAILIGMNFGIEGVAIALILAQLLCIFPAWFWVRWKVAGMKPKEYISSFIPPLLLSIMAGLSIYFIQQHVIPMGYGILVVTGILAVLMCATYLLLVMLFLRAPVMRVIALYRNRTLGS